MNIKIHRGLDQIGGCITEIWTETSRVFIDFGQNLPGIGEQTTPEQDEALVHGIISQNIKDNQAIVYSHAHEDHVGLFNYIPDDIPSIYEENNIQTPQKSLKEIEIMGSNKSENINIVHLLCYCWILFNIVKRIPLS